MSDAAVDKVKKEVAKKEQAKGEKNTTKAQGSRDKGTMRDANRKSDEPRKEQRLNGADVTKKSDKARGPASRKGEAGGSGDGQKSKDARGAKDAGKAKDGQGDGVVDVSKRRGSDSRRDGHTTTGDTDQRSSIVLRGADVTKRGSGRGDAAAKDQGRDGTTRKDAPGDGGIVDVAKRKNVKDGGRDAKGDGRGSERDRGRTQDGKDSSNGRTTDGPRLRDGADVTKRDRGDGDRAGKDTKAGDAKRADVPDDGRKADGSSAGSKSPADRKRLTEPGDNQRSKKTDAADKRSPKTPVDKSPGTREVPKRRNDGSEKSKPRISARERGTGVAGERHEQPPNHPSEQRPTRIEVQGRSRDDHRRKASTSDRREPQEAKITDLGPLRVPEIHVRGWREGGEDKKLLGLEPGLREKLDRVRAEMWKKGFDIGISQQGARRTLEQQIGLFAKNRSFREFSNLLKGREVMRGHLSREVAQKWADHYDPKKGNHPMPIDESVVVQAGKDKGQLKPVTWTIGSLHVVGRAADIVDLRRPKGQRNESKAFYGALEKTATAEGLSWNVPKGNDPNHVEFRPPKTPATRRGR